MLVIEKSSMILKKTNQETYKEEYLKTKMKKESENVQYV